MRVLQGVAAMAACVTQVMVVVVQWLQVCGGQHCHARCECTLSPSPSNASVMNSVTVTCHHTTVSPRLQEVYPAAPWWITSLTLQNCGLETLDSSVLYNLNSLQYLDLSHNNITSTANNPGPDAVNDSTVLHTSSRDTHSFQLQLPHSLRTLLLSHNKIEHLSPLKSATLEQLDICYNSLHTVTPEQMKLLQLKSLCLGGPWLQLHAGLLTKENFPSLKQLALKGTPQHKLLVKDEPARNVQQLIKDSVTALELENCWLSDTNLVMRSRGSTLRYLQVINTTILTMRIQQRNFFNISSVVSLNFTGTPFLSNAFLHPPPHVEVNTSFPQLTMLSIARTETKMLPLTVFQRLPLLNQLDISDNPLQCTCQNFGWLHGYIALNRLNLLNVNRTTCAEPPHLAGKLFIDTDICQPYTTTGTTQYNTDVYINDSTDEQEIPSEKYKIPESPPPENSTNQEGREAHLTASATSHNLSVTAGTGNIAAMVMLLNAIIVAINVDRKEET